ncbi:hypothetical protein AB833_00435 [Chromatiales bacterium (ex Bugula neritina AB1)]|nr:hypothetical protein AB833_00435 [Chromatiales bacterium (ex Bugula neritina AB1)]
MSSEMAIPVATPTDVEYLLRYFSGVDEALSRRFEIGFFPDEEHLTALLCELFDERGSELHSLPYSVNQLNSDLQSSGSLLSTSISLSTIAYNKHQERNLTQSDIGLVVKYVDRVDPSCSYIKGLLVQAKKLFPFKDRTYSTRSKYNSFNAKQHERLLSLIEHYRRHRSAGTECAAYLLYNPPISVYPQNEQEIILHRQLRHDSRKIYDYLSGLRLYKELSEDDKKHPMQKGGSLFLSLEGVHRLATRGSDDDEKVRPFTIGSVVSTWTPELLHYLGLSYSTFCWVTPAV